MECVNYIYIYRHRVVFVFFSLGRFFTLQDHRDTGVLTNLVITAERKNYL